MIEVTESAVVDNVGRAQTMRGFTSAASRSLTFALHEAGRMTRERNLILEAPHVV